MLKKLLLIGTLSLCVFFSTTSPTHADELYLCTYTAGEWQCQPKENELGVCYYNHIIEEWECESEQDAYNRTKRVIERYGLSGTSPSLEACSADPNPCLFEPIVDFQSNNNAVDIIRQTWESNETLLLTTESRQKYLLNLTSAELIWISEPTELCTPLYCKEWTLHTPVYCQEDCTKISIAGMSLDDLWEYLEEEATTILLQDLLDDTTYMLDYEGQFVIDINEYSISCNDRPCPLGPDDAFACMDFQECPIGPEPSTYPTFTELTTELFESDTTSFFLITEQNQIYLVDLAEYSLTLVSEPVDICTPLYCKEWKFYTPLSCHQDCQSVLLEDMTPMDIQDLVGQNGGMILLQNRDIEHPNMFYVIDFDENMVVDIN